MTRYSNRNGNSGVYGYEIGSDFIRIKFNDTVKIYTYSYRKAGHTHVETMKNLARNGSGLNGYVNSHVKFLYD